MRILIAIITTCTFALSQAFAETPFKYEQWRTSNDTQVVFYPTMEVPMLDINVAFKAGSAYDGEQFGISSLTTSLLNQGNNGMDADTIAEILADTGAQYSSQSNRDMAVFSLRTLTNIDAMTKAINNFSLIISHPDFPEASFKRGKNQQLRAIAHSMESPDTVAEDTFFNLLYNVHPYAHPIIGDTKHVQEIQIDDVRNFYKRHYNGSNAIIVIVGAIESKNAHEIAEKLIAEIPKGEPALAIPEATPLSADKNINVPFKSSQTVLRIGQLGISHHNKDYFPLFVGNYILGGGSLVSNLAIELREKRGLTYGVYSQFSPMPGKGPYIIGFSTRSDQAIEAAKITNRILTSFTEQGPTDSEIAAAKLYLTGSFQLSIASNRSIADVLLRIAFYNLSHDYLNTYLDAINKVTKTEIITAFQSHIKPNKLLQVSVGAM